MNGEAFGMQWMQRDLRKIKSSSQQLILDEQNQITEDQQQQSNLPNTHFLSNDVGDVQYLVTSTDDDVDISPASLDQIAAENLIFMARDGQMVTEIISGSADDRAVLVATSNGSPINCGEYIQQITSSMLSSVRQDVDGVGKSNADEANSIEDVAHYIKAFADSTPQMVTEEVITDDWVQNQGEERVEIAAEQIIGSSSQVLLDMEVPLPTVQDEYSALRPFPCDFCSRRFRKKASLMNHMVAHQTTDRSLLCKLCGVRCLRRSELMNHLRAHAEAPDSDYITDDIMSFPAANNSPQHGANITYYNQPQWQEQCDITAQNFVHNGGQTQNNLTIFERNSTATISNIEHNSNNTFRTGRGRISRLKPRGHNYLRQDSPLKNGLNTQNIKVEKEEPAQKKIYPIIDSSKPFVCQQCGLAFARQKALLSHNKTHRDDSTHECKQCGDIFWDINEMQEHQRSHQFEESQSEYDPEEADESHSESEADHLYGEFYCSECGVCFHRQDLLRRHTKMHAKVAATVIKTDDEHELNSCNQHSCSTCGKTFTKVLDLLAHAEIHANCSPLKCVLCGESFMEEYSIKRHLRSVHAHEMTQNSCTLCGKECRDRRALIKHDWEHSREKCHSCSKCGKIFHNKTRLKRHMASHRDKTVICDVCHEEFPDGRTLSNHRHSHSTTSAGKLFPCHECGKTFGSRSSQQIHVRIHTGERPYGCRYCWKAFADGGTLRKHERIHTGEKPYACSVCPRAFNQRVVLREHIRSHHTRLDAARGTYYCSTCAAELPSSEELLQHLIQHSDIITAMQRKPTSGPRKYKRRRKLKPHELAKFRSTGKATDNTSDIDMSEVDIEQVDLLDMTESSENSTNNNNCNKSSIIAKDNKRTRTTRINNNKQTMNSNKNTANTKNGAKSTLKIAGVCSVADIDLSNYKSSKKQRLDSTNSTGSDKLWPSSSSLLSNVENTLQTIETLVVGNKANNNYKCFVAENNSPTISTKTTFSERKIYAKAIKSTKSETAQPGTRTARTRATPTPATTTTTSTTASAAKKIEKTAMRPRMIHTEKCVNDVKRRGKKFNTTVTTTSMVVNDYEIMSPDAQPPAQISSSGMITKQEGNMRADLYDAQLLLEASTLRKEHYDKYNPSLVNDLEDILRSPHKCDQRRRFTSESSATQFMTEQSEEEQSHMIKIEPTSPDLRELIACSSTAVTTPTPSTPPQAVGRQTHQLTTNRKYLNFETDNGASGTSQQRQQLQRLNRPEKHQSATNYLVDFAAVVSSSSSADVTAAATAAAVAAEAAVTSSTTVSAFEQRKTRYFECEMCSAVFTDRAQLLDHVNIHI